MNAQDLRLRLRALLLRDKTEQDLDDELNFHIEMQTRKNIEAGMSEEDARRQGRRNFGRPQEACRDERRIYFVETLLQDIRYSLRGFRRAPAFALAVIATIAVGLGVNTAVFTVFNAFVLRPYDVRDPYSLYTLYGNFAFKLTDVEDLRRTELPFSDIIASQYDVARINGRQVVGELVTENYFDALGVRAVIGRMLTPDDARIGQPVAVLSYKAWKNWYGGDPGVIGKRLPVLGNPIIVGVASEGFRGLSDGFDDFWAPIGIPALRDDQGANFSVNVIGRLKPDMAKSQAQAGLALWAWRAKKSAWLRPSATPNQMDANGLLGVSPIFTAFGLVLVMACANVTNMMLARAMTRQREIGIRLSLGAARVRLIRQLLTESLLLAVPAALLGLVVSRGLVELCNRLMVTVEAPAMNFTIDRRVFGFMMAAALGSALFFGLIPALQATRPDGFKPSRLRSALVVIQITACVMLLITAGVILRGVGRIVTQELSGESDVLHLDVSEKSRRLVLSQLAADPGIRNIAGHQWGPTVSVRSAESSVSAGANYSRVSAGYLTMLGTPVLLGRDFTSEEVSSNGSVAIVNSGLAGRLWSNGDELGRSVEIIQADLPPRTLTVIGIIPHHTGSDEPDSIYSPISPAEKNTDLLLRVAGDPEQALQRIDTNLTNLVPGGVRHMYNLESSRRGRRLVIRAMGWTVAGLASLALLLTVSGIYGVLAYLVAQRKKEIGIRMALGASARSVVVMVMRQSLRLTLVGLMLGIPIALGVARVLNAFEQDLDQFFKTYDTAVYVGAAAVALAACLTASYLPLRRAATVDPAITLRHD